VYQSLQALVSRAGSSRGLAGGASLLMVVGSCVCCCDCTRIPSNEYDKDLFEEVAERRAGVKRSETNEQRKFANPRAEENCETYLPGRENL